jgi:hypothetical protein
LDLSFTNVNCPEGEYLDCNSPDDGYKCKSCFSNWYCLFSLWSLKLIL